MLSNDTQIQWSYVLGTHQPKQLCPMESRPKGSSFLTSSSGGPTLLASTLAGLARKEGTKHFKEVMTEKKLDWTLIRVIEWKILQTGRQTFSMYRNVNVEVWNLTEEGLAALLY